MPKTDQDIARAIHCAHDHGLKIQPKSGGHSYGALSSGGKDSSIIIHMKNFDSVELDTNTNITVVSAGVRLGRLADELYRQGKRAAPHGTIKNSRAWGLALDTIVAMDVVLADGRLVHVTAEKEPELWFALHGSAHSFGIITRFHLQTVAAPERVVLFSLDIDGIVDDIDEATATFLHIQNVVQDSEKVDRSLICHSNDATEDAFDAFYAQSVLVPEKQPLSKEVVHDYFECMRSLQLGSSQSWYAVINLHGGPKSQITTVPAHVSSHTHRDSLWVIQHYGYATNHLLPLLNSTKAAVKSMSKVIRKAYPEVALGAEASYHDPNMEMEVAQSLHHGNAAVTRLEALKREVDPDGMFWNPQSIWPRQDM